MFTVPLCLIETIKVTKTNNPLIRDCENKLLYCMHCAAFKKKGNISRYIIMENKRFRVVAEN